MATTTWLPYRHRKRSWLLTNGQIIDSPPIETTTSERRFRVAGTTATGYRKDIDTLIFQGVQAKAKAVNAKPWISLGQENDSDNPLNYNPESAGTAQLHFLTGGRSTTLFWKFRHPDFPVDATLNVTLSAAGGYGSQQGRMSVQLTMAYPSTNPAHVEAAYGNPLLVTQQANEFAFNWSGMDQYGTEVQTIQAWAQRHKQKDLTDLPWGIRQYDTEREAIKAVAKICRLVDDLTHVQIPDLRDTAKPALLDLGLLATNVNRTFTDTLSDYLDSTPVVTKVFESWQEIIKTFRTVGIVVGDIKKSDLYQLMTHQNKPVMIGMGPTTEEKGDTVVNTHSVTFDLATGTIAVVCSGNTHGDEVATAYETAKIRAQMTGQTDELLAFAQEYARRRGETKAKEVVADARKRDSKDPF